MKNFTMKAGTKSDYQNRAGWFFSNGAGTKVEWMAASFMDKDSARKRVLSGGWAFARPYIVVDGQKIVLA